MILVRRRYPERARARIAYVVASDLGFGMSRMYELLSDASPQYNALFRDHDEAMAWLLADV